MFAFRHRRTPLVESKHVRSGIQARARFSNERAFRTRQSSQAVGMGEEFIAVLDIVPRCN